jgi:hypothetical protein
MVEEIDAKNLNVKMVLMEKVESVKRMVLENVVMKRDVLKVL